MGRPENALDEEQGAARVGLARALRALRARAGKPSYRALADLTAQLATAGELERPYSASALSQAAGSETAPTQAVIAAYIAACSKAGPVSAEHITGIWQAYQRLRHTPGVVPMRKPAEPIGEYVTPRGAVTPRLFTRQLLLLKEQTDHSYRQLERDARALGYDLPHTTINKVLSEGRLPSRSHLEAFLHVCGISPGAAQKPWIEAWVALHGADVAAESPQFARHTEDSLAEQLITIASIDPSKASEMLRGLAEEYSLARLAALTAGLERRSLDYADQLLRSVSRRPANEVLPFIPMITIRQQTTVVLQVAVSWSERSLGGLVHTLYDTRNLSAIRAIFEAKSTDAGAINRIISIAVRHGSPQEPLASLAAPYKVPRAQGARRDAVQTVPSDYLDGLVQQPVKYIVERVGDAQDKESQRIVQRAALRLDGAQVANLYCALRNEGRMHAVQSLHEAVYRLRHSDRRKVEEYEGWLRYRGFTVMPQSKASGV